MARACVARHPELARRRGDAGDFSLGTPYFGAANAIENIVLGNEMMEIAEKLNAGNRDQRLLLNMPSFYELLPAPPDLFPSGPFPANWNLYDAGEWRWEGIRPDYLALAARRFHAAAGRADPQVETVQIAGCNLDTTVAVERSFGSDEKPQFNPVRNGKGPDAGDGTVPLWSATLPKAKMYFIQERHRYLPGNGDVIDAVAGADPRRRAGPPDSIPPRKAGLLRRGIEAPADPDAQAQGCGSGWRTARPPRRIWRSCTSCSNACSARSPLCPPPITWTSS